MNKLSITKTQERQQTIQQVGALRNQAILQIQTRQAQFLLNGRAGSQGIIGLFQFSRRIGDIWRAAQQDDPYADWTLLRIEEAIETARNFVQDETVSIRNAMNVLGAVKIELASTQEPAIAELSFSTPYVHWSLSVK